MTLTVAISPIDMDIDLIARLLKRSAGSNRSV